MQRLSVQFHHLLSASNPIRHWRSFAVSFSLIGALSVAVTGCGDAHDAIKAGLSSSCTAPADQRGSFMARVASYPLKTRVDSRFSLEQRLAIARAVGTWNQVGYSLIGKPLFEIESSTQNAASLPSKPNECSGGFGTRNSFAILRETSADKWKEIGLSKTVPAATFRCDQGRVIIQQVIYTLPELVASNQFQSIVTHELGHAIGLDHSCLDKGSRSDYRSCTGLEENNPYRRAVMYPWLRVSASRGMGEIKESLQENDQIRAQCVVDPN